MEAEKEGTPAYSKLHEKKSRLKQDLPAWVFSAGFIAKSEKTLKGDHRPCRAEWRKSEYAKLNGLVMLDIDHVGAPRERFTEIVNEWNEGNVLREDEGTKVREGENTPAADGNLAPSSSRPLAPTTSPAPTPPRPLAPTTSLAPSTSWCGAFCKHYGILFVHVTSSGYGLRIIFKGDAERGNIADNQAWMARQLGVKLDEVCKDSVRDSYCCTREDIIYVELENLLNYDDEEFEARFGDNYRRGDSVPLTDLGQGYRLAEENDGQNVGESGTSDTEIDKLNIPKDDKGNYLYRGISYADIAKAWLSTYRGGEPKVGERNNAYFSMVSRCFRYICDFNEDLILEALPDYGLSESERRQAVRSAIGQRRYGGADSCAGLPKTLFTFLKGVGCQFDGDDVRTSRSVQGAEWDAERWAKTLDPWFTSKVWKPICAYMPRYARVSGLLAGGTMFGTYLSGCRLRNWYDGSDLFLTFMTYIIGEAASGKGDYRELDRLIMEPLRQADSRGRKAEEAYQEEMKRLAVSKTKKDDVPEEKHFAVRYLPTDITLKQKLERCRYSLAQFGAEQRQVACYNFEAELSSKINYEKSSWNSSQDFDKKSFDCEMTGSESRSTMTTNGLVNAFFNFIVTGTPDALKKKVNLRNCLDGLPTRLIMGIQPSSGFKMVERSRRRRTDDDMDWLRTVGNKLMECGWDVDLEQKCQVPKDWQSRLGKTTSFADALYWWGTQKAFACELEKDEIGNYFRKRPPMIAVKFGVVDAIMNSLDSFHESGKLKLNFSSIELAIHLCDYIFESQIWFFGHLIEESLDSNAISGLKYENTKMIKGYNELPEVFSTEDIMKAFNISRRSAQNYTSSWKVSGYVEKEVKGKFKKKINVLI